MSNYAKEIGQRISMRRKELDLTLQDVADRVSVARSTIQRYETGSIDQMKMPVIQSIANALSVNPEWLLGKSAVKSFNPAPPELSTLQKQAIDLIKAMDEEQLRRFIAAARAFLD